MSEEYPSELPKLAELADASRNVSPDAFEKWFDGISRSFRQNQLARESLSKLEAELAVISGDAWSTFKEKIACSANSNRRELISLLNEAVGFARLKQMLDERNISYDCICEPESTSLKPDWIALSDGNTVAAIEVKTLFESDEEIEYIEENTRRLLGGDPPVVRMVNPIIPNGLLSKLEDSVNKGKSQLKQFVGQAELLVVYVIVNLDYEGAHVPDIRATIKNCVRQLSDELVVVVADLRSPYV